MGDKGRTGPLALETHGPGRWPRIKPPGPHDRALANKVPEKKSPRPGWGGVIGPASPVSRWASTQAKIL
jgi:hypothetical protein